MPLIESPNPKPRRVKLTLRLDEPLARTVHRYAEFIRATNEYVIAHALNYFFERDSDFKQWIASHPNGQSRNRPRAAKTSKADPDNLDQAGRTSSKQEGQS
jgi:hypothetical protein